MKKIIIGIVIAAILIAGVFVFIPRYNLEEIPEDITVLTYEGKEFKVLNLTDIQLTSAEWNAKGAAYEIAIGTITELVEKTEPHLISITGDLSYTGVFQEDAYVQLCQFIDSFGIPWAPVWGNHDNEGGQEAVEKIEEIFATAKHCIYKSGPESLGNGNYTVLVSNGKRITEGLIFMDTHCASYRENILGDMVIDSYDSLTTEQLEWYAEQVEITEQFGGKGTSIFIHIPIYAYGEAYKAADGNVDDDYEVPRDDSHNPIYWNEGYEGSFGKRTDGWGHPSEDDGALEYLNTLGTTKHIFCGHDHKNNYSILYEGVRLTYATKTGAGCYYNPELNGGTLITITDKGVADIEHIYIEGYEDIEVAYLGNDPIYGGVA